VGGAVPVRDLMDIIGKAGFTDIEFRGTTGMATSKFTEGALFRAKKQP
jgi:hypothetical protein